MIGIRQLVVVVTGVASILVSSAGMAQEFPTKPVRFIVAFGPGAVLDLVARGMAPGMSQALGQPVLVENRPGAAGLVAYEYIAKRVPPDGYDLAIGNPALASLPVWDKDLTFDPIGDLPPVSILVEAEQMIGHAFGSSVEDLR